MLLFPLCDRRSTETVHQPSFDTQPGTSGLELQN
jgi:hypothetical protein